MVLHHTASPAVVLADLAAALKPGGLLLLTDLCAHDQAWTREACGDLWLGFEPEALTRWAADAGLAQGESVYLALRNGFRIQVRVFHRTA
jgi:ArsR family transcriptional regulator